MHGVFYFILNYKFEPLAHYDTKTGINGSWKLRKGFTFSRSHTAVWFDPFVTSQVSLTAYEINGLIPMISKISSKFNKIVVGNRNWYSPRPNSHDLIAPAVATFNELHLKPQQQPMTVMMVFNFTDPSEFAITKKLADRANLIYNGTVKSLYLHYPDLSDKNVDEAATNLEKIQDLLKNTDYELGARFPIIDCGTTYIKPILKYFREIIFYRLPTDEELSQGPEMAFPGFETAFEHCISLTKSQSENEIVSIGFESAWSYLPSTDVERNSGDLVKFWKMMDNFAREKNINIVLSEAFDTPWRKEYLKDRQGWWRLIQNPLYYHSSQYIFEEKSAISSTTTTSKPQASDAAPTFLVGSERADTQSLVVDAIAEFNKGKDSDGPQIEALLTFALSHDRVAQLWDFNYIKSLADKANGIHAETVKWFYLETDALAKETVDIQHNLNIIQNSLKNTNYKLGARLHAFHCQFHNLTSTLLTLLPYIEQIIFYHYPLVEKLQDGADEVVPDLTRLFTKCLINVREIDNSISIGFQSGWLFQHGSTREGNSNNLEKSWDKMTDWAVLSKLDFVLDEALDNPELNSNRYQMGWWTLINNSSHHVLEEKKTGVQLPLGTPQLPQQSTESQLPTTIKPAAVTTQAEIVDTISKTPEETLTPKEPATTPKEFISTTTPKESISTTTIQHIDSSNLRPKFHSPPNKKIIPSSPGQSYNPTTVPPRRTTSTLEPTVSAPGTGLDTMSIILMILGITLLLVALVLVAAVVFCRPQRKRSSGNDPSLEYEIKEFYNGAENTIGEGDYIPGIRNLRYNKDLEISKTAFKIDKTATLGSGAFGAVYRGIVQKEQEIKVAIKTTKIPSPTTAISALLSEIKVMTHIGQHENVVSMIGAYTKEVRTGKIYVFLELCSLGSLEKYLRRNISAFTNSQQNVPSGNNANTGNCYEDFQIRVNVDTQAASHSYENTVVQCVKSPTYLNVPAEDEHVEAKKVSTSPDLHRWACEIANGMEFLASKSV
ncbi:Platelet-derived growth factor receptor beta [Orchesella cincta]|uniref:Platelet-derived growth factor receptor beta n=1 Tax=Orchesella cincta TaxID=48709 RepID=A0A1D2MW13_ORCCI|nr:Platelet-derived growth factor receptor beta [Orchesella cincta]